MKEFSNHKRVKSLLKVYTIMVFMLLFVVGGVFLVQNQFKVKSADQPCPGSCGSGPYCNRYGTPGTNNTWSCENVGGSGAPNYQCVKRAYNNCWYTDSNCVTHQNCGCEAAVNRCRTRCEAHFRNSPGTHEFYDQDQNPRGPERCDNCGQVVACDCTIPDRPQACPYDGKPDALNASFSQDGGASWNPNPDSINWVCGQNLMVGPVDHERGQFPLGNVRFYVYDNDQYNGLVNGNATIRSTAGQVKQVTARVEVLRPDGSSYNDDECVDVSVITCRVNAPTPTPTPPVSIPPSCNERCTVNNNTCTGGLICSDAAEGNVGDNQGRCRDTRFPNEPSCRADHTIDKAIESRTGGQSPTVTFRVTMTNTTSATVFDNVEFRDDYNTTQLGLIGVFSCTTYSTGQCVRANVLNTTNGQTYSVVFGVARNGTSGSIFHPNLAATTNGAHPLGPGRSYVVRFRYNVLNEYFLNCAEWSPEDMPPKEDCASGTVVIPTIDTDL